MSDRWVAVDERTYRRLDVATKLAGLGLIAAGLEVGGATAPGLALGVCGAVLGLVTVIIGDSEP
ncbi:hypothetical protein ACFQMA_08385 [Halosimplex aquaticum]|uniref:DUF8120 domain-containing protein n=1 Tax=Halosimplex aquaticum TaxID=3026162 RepID=A0ABD5Y630_9EURY|nr:hypothetical protein [Halosimplex aquaticum]